jgi:hypothetical protein
MLPFHQLLVNNLEKRILKKDAHLPYEFYATLCISSVHTFTYCKQKMLITLQMHCTE